MRTIILALPNPKPADGGSEGEAPGFGGFLPFLLIIVVIMLFMPLFSRKERKRQKRLGALKKHDRVVTSGGIFGTVAALDEHTVTLEVAKGVRFTIRRSSVHDMEKPGDAKEGVVSKDKAGAKS